MWCVSVTRWGDVTGRGQAEAADPVRPVQNAEKGTQHNIDKSFLGHFNNPLQDYFFPVKNYTYHRHKHKNTYSNNLQTTLVGTEMLQDFVRSYILDV